MNLEINQKDWANFFDQLSKRRYEWKTKIEILNTALGDQTLTDGLPLNGITVEARGERTTIDISVGENTDLHQTHNIADPARVAFLAAADNHGDVVDIEEADGTKTLIYFVEPMSIIAGYEDERGVAKTVP